MSDPLRSRLRAVLYTSLALVMALGLASGFKWVRGSEAAIPSAGAANVELDSPPVAQSDAGQTSTNDQYTSTIARESKTLADVSEAFVAIAQTVTPAVVSIVTLGNLPEHPRLPSGFEELFGPLDRQRQTPQSPFDAPLGRGSGFIVSEDGYVLTNNHVVAMGERIQVELPDGRRFEGALIGRDPTTDIALLKIEGKDLPTVSLGDPDKVAVGQFVLAVGNPGTEFGSDLPFTVTAGIVSAKGRDLSIIRRSAGQEGAPYAIEDFIQTDAVINPGNSGGPLVNYQGEVIGVNTAIQSTTGYYQGYGFAIPISLARDVMEDLIEYGRVRRAALRVNISAVGPADVQAFGLERPAGAVVQDFPEDSPAEKAGLQRGDVIVAIDGKPVQRVGQLQSLVASYEPGARVEVSTIRYGKPVTFKVKLAEAALPQVDQRVATVESQPGNMLIGVEVTELGSLPPQVAARAGLDENTNIEGVLVTDVADFGPAQMAGLRYPWIIQQVNGNTVKSVDDFSRALSEVKPGDVVSVNAVAVTGPDGELTHQIFNMVVPEE